MLTAFIISKNESHTYKNMYKKWIQLLMIESQLKLLNNMQINDSSKNNNLPINDKKIDWI